MRLEYGVFYAYIQFRAMTFVGFRLTKIKETEAGYYCTCPRSKRQAKSSHLKIGLPTVGVPVEQ